MQKKAAPADTGRWPQEQDENGALVVSWFQLIRRALASSSKYGLITVKCLVIQHLSSGLLTSLFRYKCTAAKPTASHLLEICLEVRFCGQGTLTVFYTVNIHITPTYEFLLPLQSPQAFTLLCLSGLRLSESRTGLVFLSGTMSGFNK